MTITRVGELPGHPEAEPEHEEYDLTVEIIGDRQPPDPESGIFSHYIDDLRSYWTAPTGHRLEVDLDESEAERAQEILLGNWREAKELRGASI
jgi:hypothetical protein